VNRSGAEYALEEGGAIRVGLGRVRGLTETTIARIVENRPYTSLADFLMRVRPQFPEAENLILAGGFDFTGLIRPALLCELRLSWRKESQVKRAEASAAGGLLFPVDATGFTRPDLNDFDLTTRRRFEYEVLGLSPDAHPMTLFDATDLLPSRSLDDAAGRRVRMGGIMAARRRVPVKRTGESMLFLTLEDVDGLFECTLFPKVYRRYGALLRDAGPYVVEGRAEDQYGAVTVNVEAVRAWSA
jgi:error-prone DNA polymerase